MSEPQVHDRAAILSIGDELAIGQSLDTNSRWIAQQLTARGIVIAEHRTLADDMDEMVRVLTELTERVPLVITTGGLGPTDDDLTRETLARVCGEELVEDAGALRALEARAKRLGRTLNALNLRQALRPASARCLENDRGTAPGIWARAGTKEGSGCDIICLPGPPFEMRAMFERDVEPKLTPPASARVTTRVLRVFGVAESDIAASLGELMARSRNPLVGTTASSGVISVRMRWTGHEDGTAALDETTQLVRERLGAPIFDDTERSLPELALDLLKDRGETLATAESCTGGLIGAELTAVPGSSRAYAGGTIAYSNELKQSLLGVESELLDAHGAVSGEVALAMAHGTLERMPHATHAISVTGIAGPEGGSDDKPVGTVWIGLDSQGGQIEARRFRLRGDRGAVRQRAVQSALAMLVFRLKGLDLGEPLWQVEHMS